MAESLKDNNAGTGSLYQFFAVSCSFLAGAALYIFIAKHYPSSFVGSVSLFVAITGIFNSVFSLGFTYASRHFISFFHARLQFSKARYFIFRTVAYSSVSASFGSLVLLILAPPIAVFFFHSLDYVFIIRVLSLYLFLYILFGIFMSILFGMQLFKLAAKISIITTAMAYPLAACLLIIYGNPVGILWGWILGYGLGTLLLFLQMTIRMRTDSQEKEPFPFVSVFSYAFPVLFAGIIGAGATSVDRLVVASFVNLSSLGVYNFALIILSALSLLTSPIYNVLLPKLSEMYSLNRLSSIREAVRVTTNFVSLAYVPAAIGSAVLGNRILVVLSGRSYVGASAPLFIMLLVYAIFVSSGIFSQVISAVRKTRVFILTSAFSLLSNFTLSLLLIPKYNIVGAAAAFSSVMIVTFLVLSWYMHILKTLYIDLNVIGKIWLASCLMGVAVYLTSILLSESLLNLLVLILSGLIFYWTLVRVLHIIDARDKALLTNSIKDTHKRFALVLTYIL